MNTQVRYRLDDNTEPTPMYLLPELEEIEVVLRRFPTVTVAFYNPCAGPRDPWLWLDTPHGVVKIYESYEPDIFETVIRRAAMVHQLNRVECPKCKHTIVQASAPRGTVHCAECYKNTRVMQPMLWRGQTIREQMTIL